MTNVLLTGITGLVGSSFATEALRRDGGLRLTALVRGQGTKNAHIRVREILEEQCVLDGTPELTEEFLARVEIVAGDVADEEITTNKHLLKGYDAIFHCAADVNLGKDPFGHTYFTNYQGAKNMVKIAKAVGVKNFQYVSTAYVSGHHDGVVKEDGLLPSPAFNNAYEKSKYYGEQMVRASGLPFTIYRPSIIVGRLTDGAIRKPLAFYRILEFLLKLKKHHCAKKHLVPSDLVDLPLRLEAMPSESVYFVPVDYIQKTIASLFFKPPTDTTYHLTGNSPVSTKAIERVVAATLKVNGVVVQEKVVNPSFDEKLVHKFIGDLLPYFSSQSVFDLGNVIAAEGAESLEWGLDENKLVMLIGGFFQNIFPELADVRR